LFFRIEKNHARDYASRGQIYNFIHLTLRLFSTPTVADVIDYLEYYTIYIYSSSTMATGCDRRSFDPLRGTLGVHMRNRKLCNTHSSKQCWLGCSLRRPRPIIIGNPASYI
jgi:hypothetical protein